MLLLRCKGAVLTFQQHRPEVIAHAHELLTESGAAPELIASFDAAFSKESTATCQGTTLVRRLRRTNTQPGAFFADVEGDLDALVGRLALITAELEIGEPSVELALLGMDLYGPLAERMGLWRMRQRLEDAAFLLVEPEAAAHMKAAVNDVAASDEAALDLVLQAIAQLAERNQIQATVTGRRKHLYGLYQKVLNKKKPLETILDRVAVRVIVDSVPECYLMLGLVHSHFRPVEGAFKDYIGLPKPNGYQSLHTTVNPLRHLAEKPIEIQIRTNDMHEDAEFGIAAHWRYKVSSRRKLQAQLNGAFLADLAPLKAVSDEFVPTLRRQIRKNHIVIFVTGGQIIRVPEGITVGQLLGSLKIPGPYVVDGRPADPRTVLQDGSSVQLPRKPTDDNPLLTVS